MPEEQAFSVLVKIIYNYGHRDVFKANFQNLHLMFYQLDKLMDVSHWMHLKVTSLPTASLVPRPFPDFISQMWQKLGRFLHSCDIKSGSGLGTRLARCPVLTPQDFITYSTANDES